MLLGARPEFGDGYKAKYRKLPTLGDDVTDDEGEEGDDDGDGDGDGDFD